MSFKIVECNDPIVTAFIPVEIEARTKFYKYFAARGIILPDYESITRCGNMRKQDLMVVSERLKIVFGYNGVNYILKVRPGLVFDGASVPISLVNGDLTKFGQAVELAALVHDILFATKSLPYKDCNAIFKGFLESTGLLSKLVIWEYFTGVNSFIGKRIYEKGIPENYWGNDYYTFVKGLSNE